MNHLIRLSILILYSSTLEALKFVVNSAQSCEGPIRSMGDVFSMKLLKIKVSHAVIRTSMLSVENEEYHVIVNRILLSLPSLFGVLSS